MIRADLLQRVSELRAARMPFVVATVVRVAKPASAHAGDSAILLPDGTLEGFVGGMCSESTVRTQGLRQLASGRSILLHITPPSAVSVGHAGPGPAALGMPGTGEPALSGHGQAPGPARQESAGSGHLESAGPGHAESAGPGYPRSAGLARAESQAESEDEVTVGNPCLSGGSLDIFLEVMRPPALVHLYGDTPVARALGAVGAAAGLDVRPTSDPGAAIPADATAVVVASQGGDEHRVLLAALDTDVPYIGLLASRRRGSAVIEALGLDPESRARVHTPAGLDIGAQSPGEVAVSILAEIIGAGAMRHPFHSLEGGTGGGAAAGRGAAEAVDPVCGMTVAVSEAAIHVETQDETVYFCCPGCRDAYLADPGRYTHSL